MNKKAILFDGQSKESDSGKTTSSILLLKKLIEEGYSPEEFYVHTPNDFQKYQNKNGLISTCGKILEKCTSHDYYKQFACYKLANNFIGEKSDDVFTYNDLIEGHIDFFCLLCKNGKWVLIFSTNDYKKFIDLLALIIVAIHSIHIIKDTFVLVTTIKDKKRGNIRGNIILLVNTVDSNPDVIYTTYSKVSPLGVESTFYLPKNKENAQKAFELIQSY